MFIYRKWVFALADRPHFDNCEPLKSVSIGEENVKFECRVTGNPALQNYSWSYVNEAGVVVLASTHDNYFDESMVGEAANIFSDFWSNYALVYFR